MNAKQKIQAAIAYKGITQAELAKMLGMSAQVFSKRISTGKFTLQEWEKIAEVLGAKFEAAFVFPDGGRI